MNGEPIQTGTLRRQCTKFDCLVAVGGRFTSAGPARNLRLVPKSQSLWFGHGRANSSAVGERLLLRRVLCWQGPGGPTGKPGLPAEESLPADRGYK
jgi:hypothetical protein